MTTDRVTTEQLGELCAEADAAEENAEVARFEADIARADYRLALIRYRNQGKVQAS